MNYNALNESTFIKHFARPDGYNGATIEGELHLSHGEYFAKYPFGCHALTPAQVSAFCHLPPTRIGPRLATILRDQTIAPRGTLSTGQTIREPLPLTDLSSLYEVLVYRVPNLKDALDSAKGDSYE